MLEQHAEASASAVAEPPKKNSRKQKVSIDTSTSLIPAAKATKKATRANAESIKQKVYLDHMEPMLQESFLALRRSARNGDHNALKLILEVTQFIAGKGPAVALNINNRNEARAEAAAIQPASSFDSLVRKLDERDSKMASAKDFIDV